MKRSFVALFFAGLLVAAPSTALASKIGKSMGNLRWGMSDTEVTSVVKNALKKEYNAKLKKASGGKKAAIKSEYKRRLKAFQRSHVDLEGRSRWDSTSAADEYTHGNDESMMVLEGDSSDNYYFFIEGRLWKWVRTMPSHSFGSFAKFSKSIKKKFGKGRKKSGQMTGGTSESYQFLEFLDRSNRMRAVDKTSAHGEYALVFEEMATVRNLSALRMNTPKRSKARRSSVASRSSKPDRSTTLRSARGNSKKRRSIFADEGGDESESAYQARKKKVEQDRKRKQRAMFERKQDAKKGKVLDELEGIDDDDPLSGMR